MTGPVDESPEGARQAGARPEVASQAQAQAQEQAQEQAQAQAQEQAQEQAQAQEQEQQQSDHQAEEPGAVGWMAGWLGGRVAGRGGHTGALVAAGWATYNAVWLGVLSGFATTRGTGVGTTWPLYLYSGGVGLTFVFAGLITVSRWRHPVEPRQHSVSTRGDAGLLGALGIIFAGLSVVFGSWWAPFSLVMLVMAIWLVVKDASARHRAPS